MTPPNEDTSRYMHGVDAGEQERLELLAVLLGGAEFLPPLRAGMCVLEVGCGTGAIAREVAAKVAPGEVIGVDREEAQLATAKKLATAHGVDNLRFHLGPAEAIDLPDGACDAAYCRFLLEHVADPVKVVAEMARVVKPGGWVCGYEWDNSCGTIHPDSPAVKQVWDAIYKLQDLQGGDSMIARKLYGVFVEADLVEVTAKGTAWTITAEEREKLEGYVGGAREIISQTREGMLAENLVTPTILSQAAEEYQRLLQSPHAYVFEGFCRVVGKPG
jgi:ubiquinone/menaquinone biosynthesis C-methylase UbiE